MWRGHPNMLTPEQVARRAGGRRKINSLRQLRAHIRRLEVVKLLAQGLHQIDIAVRLEVNPSTISRDVRALFAGPGCCPTCGRLFSMPLWDML